MTLLMKDNTIELWQSVVQEAEQSSDIQLSQPLESYLVDLLDRSSSQPEIIGRIIAVDFLEAMNCSDIEREFYLQEVGDHCLIFSGLFPKMADKRHVKLSYFVQVGRSAYHAVSDDVSDVFTQLACQFVNLMDVLQTIRVDDRLLPLEAYEQWQELGSKRALKALNSYTRS